MYVITNIDSKACKLQICLIMNNNTVLQYTFLHHIYIYIYLFNILSCLVVISILGEGRQVIKYGKKEFHSLRGLPFSRATSDMRKFPQPVTSVAFYRYSGVLHY